MSLHTLVIRCFAALAEYSIRHPRRVVALAAVLTLAIAPGVTQLKLRTDGHALVDQDAPEVRFDQAIRDEFGIEDPVAVIVRARHPDGIFNPATLQLVRDLTSDFQKIPGVRGSNIVSLATERGFRTRPSTLIFRTFLETPRQTKAELEELREDLRRIELYTGTILSYDGQSAAILIGAAPGLDRTKLYQSILDLIAARGEVQDDIAVTGAPVAEALLGIHILEDLGVPKALLGTSTRSALEKPAWKWPENFYEFRLLVARHAGLVPVSMALMALIFFVSFRTLAATALPMIEVGASLIFVFGLMGYLGVPVYLTIAVMPVLLTAMAVTDEIHIYSRYFALLRERPDAGHVELARTTMEEMIRPVVNTSLTTAIGFVSFGFSPLGPVQAFGIFTGLGVLFCLVWSLSVMPALLVWIDPKWFRSPARRKTAAGALTGSSAFGALALAVVRCRWVVLGATAVVIALTPLGLRRLVIQDSWIDGFDPDSRFSRTTRFVNEQYRGVHLLYVSFDASKSWRGTMPAANAALTRFVLPANATTNAQEWAGCWLHVSLDAPGAGTSAPRAWRSVIDAVVVSSNEMVLQTQYRDENATFWRDLPTSKTVHYQIIAQPHLQPELLRTIADLDAFIEARTQYKVGSVLSPADYVATTRFMVRPNEPGSRRLPADTVEAKLMFDYYRIVRGPGQLRQVVDAHYGRSLLAVFLKEANFMDTEKLMRDIRAYEREHLTPHGIRLGFAGDTAVSQSLIRSIVTTQLQSLFGSLAGILAVTSLLGRSLRWGVYCVLPSALAVLINFAVMGWFGIPLGVATSMFAGMTLGLGVDFAIHLLEGFGAARAQGLAPEAALRVSMSRTGPAVLVNTLAISVGFGVLVISQVPANARLGVLTILGLVNCLIASVALLPVLLHAWPLKNRHAKTASTQAPE